MALSEADLQLVFEASGIKELIAQTKALNAAMEKLIAEGNKAEGEMHDLGKSAKGASGDMGGLGKAMGGLGEILGGLGIAVGVSGILELGKSAISSAIAYETLSVQFEVFLGSAEKAQQVLGDLNKFSIETPFTPDQVNAAGRSLLAFGVTAENLIPTMKQIGDVSAAVGKDYNELATIFGKAKTAGTIFAEDINQLAEAGVPIIDELAKVFGVATDQVKKLGSEGKIHFTDLEKAFANMTGEGGRFNGMMDKMSQSTEGLLSTIEGKLQDEIRAIGQAMLPTIRTIAEGFEPAFASLKAVFTEIYAPVGDIISAFSSLFKALGLGSEEGNAFADIVGVIATAFKVILYPTKLIFQAVGFLVQKFADFLGFAGDVIAKVGEIGNAFDVILFPMRAVGAAWDLLFGEAETKAGLAASSIGALGAAAEMARQKMGATNEQLWAFTKAFDANRLAGLSQKEAMNLVVGELAAFIQKTKETTAGTEDLIEVTKLSTNTFKFAAGSIGHYEELLKLLQDRYKAATTDMQRFSIHKEIEVMQFHLARFNTEVERMAPRMQEISGLVKDAGSLPMNTFSEAIPAIEDFNDKLSITGHLIKALGETGFEKLKQGLDSIKAAFLDFAATTAQAIGQAIAAGSSVGDVFRAAMADLFKEIPKLAGMAMLNAAAGMGPSPAALGLAIGGLALLGLSGLIGGLQQRNQERADQQVNMDGLQGSVGRQSNPQGLAQHGQSMMPPIQLQVTLDGAVIAHAIYDPLKKEQLKRR